MVPAYNAAGFLGLTLDSVGAQSYGNVEVIVVDDGSADGTAEVAEGHPTRPRVVRQANAGHAAARNHGALSARGEWLAFLDHDDLWHRDHIARALGLASRAAAQVVATGYI
ncbi:MAG: glycosyltransferase family 2 protein, partial [Acidimicrobiales bacterium]